MKVPIFKEVDNADPCNPQYNQTKEIGGFAVVDIYGAKCGNADTAAVDEDYPTQTCAAPADKYVLGVLRCDLDSEEVGGGGFDGIMSKRMRLVQ